MKANVSLMCAMALLLSVGSFWVGRVWGLRHVLTYQVDQYRVSFHADDPTYGLPLVAYDTILAALRSGDTNTAIQKAEVYLDLAVYDAKRRRPLLSGWGLSELDKSLRRTAQYRQHWPIQVFHPDADGVRGMSRWRAEEEVRDAEWRREIDTFLADFN